MRADRNILSVACPARQSFSASRHFLARPQLLTRFSSLPTGRGSRDPAARRTPPVRRPVDPSRARGGRRRWRRAGVTVSAAAGAPGATASASQAGLSCSRITEGATTSRRPNRCSRIACHASPTSPVDGSPRWQGGRLWRPSHSPIAGEINGMFPCTARASLLGWGALEVSPPSAQPRSRTEAPARRVAGGSISGPSPGGGEQP